MERPYIDAVHADIEALRQKANLIVVYNEAVNLFQQGNLDNAELLANKILSQQPNYANGHYLLALIAGRRGQFRRAEQLISIAIANNPQEPVFHNVRASALNGFGQKHEALAAYKMAIQLDPKSATAYVGLAGTLAAIGELEEAGKAVKTALQYNPGLTTAKHLSACLGLEDLPSHAPDEYVANLFDTYAERFERHLIDELGYAAPQHLYDAVRKQIENRPTRLNILDLGCGTGLSGVLYSDVANILVGVDLSAQMIAKAREKNAYTDLMQAEAHQALKQTTEMFDLIVAVDVFGYIGQLDALFVLANERLKPNGMLAFTIENNDMVGDYALTMSGRYTHSLEYVRRISVDNLFKELTCDYVTLRHDKGAPVPGCVVLLCGNLS